MCDVQELVRKGGKLPVDERKKTLEKLESEDVPFKPGFKVTVLRWAGRDEESIEAFVKMITPYAYPSDVAGFTVTSPMLAKVAKDMSDLDLSALFLKMVVHDKLLPMISNPDDTEKVVQLCKETQGMPEKRSGLLPVMEASCLETLDICALLIGLHNEVVSEGLMTSFQESKSGAKALVRHAITQSSWKQLEAKVRQHRLAQNTFGSEVDALVSSLTAREQGKLREGPLTASGVVG